MLAKTLLLWIICTEKHYYYDIFYQQNSPILDASENISECADACSVLHRARANSSIGISVMQQPMLLFLRGKSHTRGV